MLSLITAPTTLQAKTEVDGSFTVAVPSEIGFGLSFSDYTQAEMDGHIDIVMTEPLSTGYIAVTYFVN